MDRYIFEEENTEVSLLCNYSPRAPSLRGMEVLEEGKE